MKKITLLAGAVLALGMSVSAQCQLPPVWKNVAEQKIQKTDERKRVYITPTRIVWKSSEDKSIVDNEEQLLKSGIGQSVLGSSHVCRLKSSNGQNASLLFDFGKELQGGIQIITGQSPVNKPVKVRIRFGESVSEAMCDVDGKNGATNDHAMRDFETMQVAMTAAETGHLVFSTLHTIGTASTIDRIIDVFPANQQRQITVQLSMVLQAVICQQLVPSVRGNLIPAFEIMTMNPAIRNMIRDGKVPQIDGILYSSANNENLVAMDTSLAALCRSGQITEETALAYASNPEMMKRKL